MNELSKILDDPYYRDTYRHFKSINDVKSAGFFNDKLKSIPYFLSYGITPINKIKNKITKRQPVVLITTGAFAPIHDGHVSMMESSKKYLEDNGFDVLGGYFSTGHDNYALSKYNSSINIPLFKRISLINQKK